MAGIDEEISLESYVVNGGDDRTTKIVCTPELGRAVVATRDFPVVGEVMLRERPLLVWNTRGNPFSNYLDCFLDAPQEVKALVLDMHTPPEDSSFMKSLAGDAVLLSLQSERYLALGVEKIIKLLGVSNINSHEYYGTPSEAFYDVVSESQRLHSGKSALFAYGSKVAHSCHPNASYSSKTADGCLQYKVISPIKGGDQITFSYLNNSPSLPTHLRREDLMSTKVFFCECQLCTGLDYARMHQCPSGSCTGKIAIEHPGKSSKHAWRCTECGQVDEETVSKLLRKEAMIKRKFDSMVAKLTLPGGVSNVHPSQAEDLVSQATRVLSNTHFLTLKCLSKYSIICASHAHGVSEVIQRGLLPPNTPTPFGSLTCTTLRVQSASANLAFVGDSAPRCFGSRLSPFVTRQRIAHSLMGRTTLNSFFFAVTSLASQPFGNLFSVSLAAVNLFEYSSVMLSMHAL